MCSQLRAIFKQFKSAEDDTSTVVTRRCFSHRSLTVCRSQDDLEDDLIGLNELVAFLEVCDLLCVFMSTVFVWLSVNHCGFACVSIVPSS